MKETGKKVIALSAALAAVVGMAAFTGGWTQKQSAVHDIAEQARALGLPDDNPIIVECQRIWWEEHNQEYALTVLAPETAAEGKDVDTEIAVIPEAPLYDEIELNILAKVIWKEALGCPWEHMCAVGCVVLNRVADDRFPGTIYDVVAQPGQYAGDYVSGFDGIPDECYEAAKACLEGEYTIPHDVVWQANFRQGNGVWWTSYVDTGWWRSTTYFCY